MQITTHIRTSPVASWQAVKAMPSALLPVLCVQTFPPAPERRAGQAGRELTPLQPAFRALSTMLYLPDTSVSKGAAAPTADWRPFQGLGLLNTSFYQLKYHLGSGIRVLGENRVGAKSHVGGGEEV